MQQRRTIFLWPDAVTSALSHRFSSTHDPGESHAGSRWAEGSSGVSWKERHLNERRERALEFMFDVTRRRPITDALRKQASLNASRLRMDVDGDASRSDPEASTVLLDTLEPLIRRQLEDETRAGESEREAGSTVNRLLWETVEDAMDEGINEETCLSHLSESDAKLIVEEMFTSASAEADQHRSKVLKNWFRLRRDNPLSLGYHNVPVAERTEWSPWYLKDITSREPHR